MRATFFLATALMASLCASSSDNGHAENPPAGGWGFTSYIPGMSSVISFFTSLSSAIFYKQQPSSASQVVTATSKDSIKIDLNNYSRLLSYKIIYKELKKTTMHVEIFCSSLAETDEAAGECMKNLMSILNIVAQYPNAVFITLTNISIAEDPNNPNDPALYRDMNSVHSLTLKRVKSGRPGNSRSTISGVLERMSGLKKLSMENCDIDLSNIKSNAQNPSIPLSTLETLIVKNSTILGEIDSLLRENEISNLKMVWLDSSNLRDTESLAMCIDKNRKIHTIWIENEENIENISFVTERDDITSLKVFSIKRIKVPQMAVVQDFAMDVFPPSCRVYFIDSALDRLRSREEQAREILQGYIRE